MRYIVASDTGGTFTDVAAFDTERGRLVCTKSLTTYHRLVEGVMSCVGKAGVPLAEAESMKHGTTLVINTFLQRNGARAALVTTGGFRDLLETRRGNRPVPFRLDYHRDPELIPRDLRFEVSERVDAGGNVLRPLDPDELRGVALQIRVAKVEAVAISFLNAYLNPMHEDQAAELLRSLLPDLYITTGTALTREWYEYERTATAAANAYVGPTLTAYSRDFDAELARAGFQRRLYMMASNGGVYSVARAAAEPVMLVESGPVGGAIGAAAYARALGLSKAIAFDMGGTTAKCALVEDGRYEVKSPYYVGGYEKGFPIRGAVLDVVEVGAGGGSIAWLDRQGRLNVGPRSAGSTPGPVCYGRGGTEPTVTDANLVLSRIDDSSFLGGEMRLDAGAARSAIERLVARPLGLDGPAGVDRAAQGVLALSSARMSGAIREITIQRGLDPRDFTLIAFGGGGPLHAVELARELYIPRVIVPPNAGNFSTIGMLLSSVRIDASQTFLRRLSDDAVSEMSALFDAIAARAAKSILEDTGSAEHIVERFAEMRYLGQRHSLRTPIEDSSSASALRRQFDETYRRRYGHADSNTQVEIVNLTVNVSAPPANVNLQQVRGEVGTEPAKPRAIREVYFDGERRRVPSPVYRRGQLPIGFAAQGPAIIEEYGTTTVVGPDDQFTIGVLGEISIECAAATSGAGREA